MLIHKMKFAPVRCKIVIRVIKPCYIHVKTGIASFTLAIELHTSNVLKLEQKKLQEK